MKKILDSFINFTLTLSGRANPNTERQSFLTAFVFSSVHLLCSLFLLRCAFVLFIGKVNTLKK